MVTQLSRWQGKTALVTGASSGVGAAVAVAMGRHGLRLVIAGRDEARLRRVAAAIDSTGERVMIAVVDQADLPANERLFDLCHERWGTVDVLINNAGMSGGRGLSQVDPCIIESCFDLNVHAAVRCMQAAVRDMADKTDAAIINISSLAGHRIPRNSGDPSVAYAASKHALRAFTDGLRVELGTRGSAIQVALISPGMIDTPWHVAHQAEDREAAYGFRPLDPADIAQAVLYILSTPRHVQVCDLLLRPIGQTF